MGRFVYLEFIFLFVYSTSASVCLCDDCGFDTIVSVTAEWQWLTDRVLGGSWETYSWRLWQHLKETYDRSFFCTTKNYRKNRSTTVRQLTTSWHHVALFCNLNDAFAPEGRSTLSLTTCRHCCSSTFICAYTALLYSHRVDGRTELRVLPYLDTSWRHTCVKTEQVVQHTAYVTQMTQEQLSITEK